MSRWPAVNEQCWWKAGYTFLLARGKVSGKEGTIDVIVERLGVLGDLHARVSR